LGKILNAVYCYESSGISGKNDMKLL